MSANSKKKGNYFDFDWQMVPSKFGDLGNKLVMRINDDPVVTLKYLLTEDWINNNHKPAEL